MSRSGYSDGLDNWDLIRWRGAVKQAIRGKRGQEFLRDLARALDSMPNRRLIANELESADGEYCALGALGARRSLDLGALDPEDPRNVGEAFGIARALAAEVVFENDEGAGPWSKETPEERWARVRAWVQDQLSRSPKPNNVACAVALACGWRPAQENQG